MLNKNKTKRMCLFRSAPSPKPMATPPPTVARVQPQQRELPRKRDLVDPDELAGVEYGTAAKKQTDTRGAAKRVGTDALKINLNTGSGASGAGGLNV